MTANLNHNNINSVILWNGNSWKNGAYWINKRECKYYTD